MHRRLSRLLRDNAGAAMLEFALLAPAITAMMLGVLQVGMALQNYHALRNISADVARYAMVQFATGNTLTIDQLRNYALWAGGGVPYLLNPQEMSASVSDAGTPRVTGVSEKTLTINYQVSGLFDAVGLRGPYLSYSRPIFLTTPGS
jgi:Flp pilus assembly pilin Flp